MLKFSKFISWCLNPEKVTDISSTGQQKIEYSNKEINEEQKKKKILITPSPKISLLHLKRIKAQLKKLV